MVLPIGSIVSDFTLPCTTGEDFNLARDAAGKVTVLYIYPSDFSPICTSFACAFRDTFEFFNELGINVYGISPDNMETHRRFKDSHQLQFELLSDPERKVIKSLGLLEGLSFLSDKLSFTKRVTFVLNKDLKIISSYENNFFPQKAIKKLIENIKKLDISLSEAAS
jgi:peroxiredoxin Q/BCP